MNDCCIYINAEVEEEPSFVKTKMTKAAKEHICTECERTIEKGETYEYVVGSWHKELRTYRTCPDCLSIRKELFDDDWYYEFIWEDLERHVANVGDKVLNCDIRQMTELARDKLLDLVEESWNTN